VGLLVGRKERGKGHKNVGATATAAARVIVGGALGCTSIALFQGMIFETFIDDGNISPQRSITCTWSKQWRCYFDDPQLVEEIASELFAMKIHGWRHGCCCGYSCGSTGSVVVLRGRIRWSNAHFDAGYLSRKERFEVESESENDDAMAYYEPFEEQRG